MNLDVLGPFRFRHACKRFDAHRPLAAELLGIIMEAGRLAPSAFGLEPWIFVVTEDRQRITALATACFDQVQVGTSSAVVTILARVSDLAPDSRHVARQTVAMSEVDRQWMGNYYSQFCAGTDVAAWSVSQCMFAAAHMMLAAAALGVDSCPIGGFDEKAVRMALGLRDDGTRVALVLPFGYRAEEPAPRHRLPLTEILTRV